MPLINLRLSGAIFLSGVSGTKAIRMLNFMKVSKILIILTFFDLNHSSSFTLVCCVSAWYDLNLMCEDNMAAKFLHFQLAGKIEHRLYFLLLSKL